MSKEYTKDEVREMFLSHIKGMVKYWGNVDGRSTEEKLDGLAFSMLTMLDGCSGDIPAFIVAPAPHSSDKEFLINEGSDYYPENHELEDQIKCDIGGGLHEYYSQIK